MKMSELDMNEFTFDSTRNSYKRKEGSINREYKKIVCDKCKEYGLIRFKSKSIYCSKQCSQKDKKRPQTTGDKHGCWKGGISLKTHPCVDCGKEIKLRSTRCRECSKNFQRGCNGGNWKGGISKSKCIDCGKEITGYSKRCRTCFDKINKGDKNAMFGRKGSETNRWNEDIVQKYCDVCGKPFKRGVNSTVCIKCYGGKYTPSYIDGRSYVYDFYKYSKDFRNKLKNKIKKRDGNICQYPNCNNNTNLCVHHIDYDKQNSNESNLITLCCSCHMKTNHNREYHEKLMKDVINEREKNR